MLAVALVAFVTLAVIGWRSLPSRLEVSRSPLILAMTVFVPITFVLKAMEFRLAARFLDTRVGWIEAFEVAVLGAAANLLPLPGSVIVTTRSLSAAGHTRTDAFGATTALGVCWLGVTGVLAGGALTATGSVIVGLLLLAGGIVGVWVSHGLIGRRFPEHRNLNTAHAVLLESGFVAMDALRLLLILQGLGVSASALQTIALTASSALTAATGFLPAGLGLREALVAGIAPLVDLPASTGLVVAVIDRLQWIAVLALLSGVLALVRARRTSS